MSGLCGVGRSHAFVWLMCWGVRLAFIPRESSTRTRRTAVEIDSCLEERISAWKTTPKKMSPVTVWYFVRT
jgi:hypothetical protein